MYHLHHIIRVVVLLPVCILATQVKGQRIILADDDLHTTLPWATASLTGSSRGFVADESGRVVISDVGSGDSLVFRCIGYRSLTMVAKDLYEGDTIFLTSDVMELEEAVVRSLPPDEYVLMALRSVPENYRTDSFATLNFFTESLKENDRYVSDVEAFLETIHPGYFVERDSFIMRIRAGRMAEGTSLEFMEKERDKESRKASKKAKKKGEDIDEEDSDAPPEFGDPPTLLKLDPLRHPEHPLKINDDDVNFLDSANHDDYEFWYGSPVRNGDRTLVVVHFDQREKVRRTMMAGTIWIDEESNAFVKISFGLSKRGEKHALPGVVKAALWLYGLRYELHNNNISFEYQPFGEKWTLHAVRMTAELFLERRRVFNDNDLSTFTYRCELLTTEVRGLPYAFISATAYDHKKLLSEQLINADDDVWQGLMRSSRTFR